MGEMLGIARHTVPTVRKFEMGASGVGLDDMLQKLGYRINGLGNHFKVWEPGKKGRPMAMSRKKLMKILDDVRVSQGLEPILKR